MTPLEYYQFLIGKGYDHHTAMVSMLDNVRTAYQEALQNHCWLLEEDDGVIEHVLIIGKGVKDA